MSETLTILFQTLLASFALLGWLKYFDERGRSRDYATDLSQLIHDYRLDYGDLRRSLKHSEIHRAVERVKDGGPQ